MKKFELTILGSNSAMPAFGRFPTSQIINFDEQLILIDCGEGCQIRLSQYKIRRNKISHILISHLHGDHLYGLPGVLTSLNHLSRTKPLEVFGPVGIKKYINTCFEVGEVHLNYPLKITEIDSEEEIIISDQNNFAIKAFPVIHRIPTYAYKIIEKPSEKKIIKSVIDKYNLSIEQIKKIKNGNDLVIRDTIIENKALTHPSNAIRSYAFCADTKFSLSLLEYLKGINTMYYETTYMDELKNQAHERGHSTAKEAGQFASLSGIKLLVTGHYSSRYKNLDDILAEVKSEFPNAILGYDGLILNIQ